MELLPLELFLTAVFAVLFSFLISKLVSVAISTNDSGVGGNGTGGDAVELRFGEEKLICPDVGSDRRVVEPVDEVLWTVDRFEDQQVLMEKVRDVEQSVCGEEAGLDCGVAAEELSEITELPDTEVYGEVEVLAGGAVECDVEETEGNDDEALREVDLLGDAEVRFPVVEVGEAADVVAEEEEKEAKEKEVAEEEGKEEKEVAEKEEKEAKEKEVTEEEEKEESVDDDDWEGIERTELEKDFSAAARFADDSKGRLEAAMGDDVKMQLYGLHKVATEGPCRDSPPVAVKVAARAKWNAWQRLGNMNPDSAMEQYINLLSESIPNWREEKSVEMGESDVSTLQQQDSPSTAVSGHEVESAVVGCRETSVGAEVNLDDPGLEANSVGRV